jgi:hypothetical protein
MKRVLRRAIALVACLVLVGSVIPATAAGAIPNGSHDGPDGLQSQNTCSAWGWAVDRDHPGAIVTVRVLVDGTEVARGPADDFRQDLYDAGVSPTGKASFVFSLWGKVSTDVWHAVVVEALDLDATDSWVPLDASPRRISCHKYDMFDYERLTKDMATGTVSRLTNATRRSSWNAAWSPEGTRIAHDVVLADPGAVHGVRGYLGITRLADGRTTAIKGTSGGNDAAWSPDAKSIAFDRVTAGDASIYVIPAVGGTRRLIRHNAASAEFSPSGKRIVFLEPSSSRIMTMDSVGRRPVVVARLRRQVDPEAAWFDVNPTWSPDGRWIAYSDGGHIWKVRVGSTGTPLAGPVRLTSGKATAYEPSWTPDGASIVYQATYADDPQIWQIEAKPGAIPIMLTDRPQVMTFGDNNGVLSPDGKTLVYSALDPVTPS